MKAHEKRLAFEIIERIARELEAAPAFAEKIGREYATKTIAEYPDRDPALFGIHSGRTPMMEVGALEQAGKSAATELRALVKAFGPRKARVARG